MLPRQLRSGDCGSLRILISYLLAARRKFCGRNQIILFEAGIVKPSGKKCSFLYRYAGQLFSWFGRGEYSQIIKLVRKV
jgi:hypothetical protein